MGGGGGGGGRGQNKRRLACHVIVAARQLIATARLESEVQRRCEAGVRCSAPDLVAGGGRQGNPDGVVVRVEADVEAACFSVVQAVGQEQAVMRLARPLPVRLAACSLHARCVNPSLGATVSPG